MAVGMRAEVSRAISLRRAGAAKCKAGAPFFAGAADSSRVFHSPQAGHFPDHFAVVLPQALHLYWLFCLSFLAITKTSFQKPPSGMAEK